VLVDVLGQMHLFVKVVEHGGFTAAARDLGVPKSTVSRQVARLEDRLGVRLLERTTRALRTTEVGQAYYERCTRILAEVVEAEGAVTEAQAEPRGRLRISAPLTFGYLFLGEVIAAFLQSHPQVRIDISLTDRRVDLIDEGFDLAIRIGQLDDSTLVARRLGWAAAVVAASPEYLSRFGRPQVPEELRQHRCLHYEYRGFGWRFGGVSVPVDGPLVSNNGDLLRAAAVAGLGIIITPRFIIADELRDGRLVSILEEHLGAEGAGIWAIYPANRHLSAKVRSFVDFAVARFGQVAPWER
jgi:DNA-binding transcriptional LysR family regulator